MSRGSRLRICSFETRAADAMRSLIQRRHGTAILAPSVQEVSSPDDSEVLAFSQELLDGRIDLVLFLTGVGTERVLEVLEDRSGREPILAALSRCRIGVRGPKPAAVLRRWRLSIDYQAGSPYTWRELVEALDAGPSLHACRVAVQEYGRKSLGLHAALKERGADVRSVMIYRWTLPPNLEPLRHAIAATVRGDFDVLAFTTAVQVDHVLQVADQMQMRSDWLRAARRCVVASVGPSTSEAIRDAGLPVDIEPDHPKMGQLVNAIFDQAPELLATCRTRRGQGTGGRG
ncbi:MAG: uroporphyrinogen-III synthase [Planctomycetes bacterium]|nr:uroporphyrinogen-III synthase [Planctomycetota bacterium]